MAKNVAQPPYRRQGEGEAVVFVHGLGMSGSSWDRIAEKVASHGFSCLTYDQRGFGEAELPNQDYVIADLVDDLAALIAGLGLKKLHLVGHSLGGMVALAYAINNPNAVATLTLVCTTAHNGARAGKFARGLAKLAESGFDAAAADPQLRQEIEQILSEGFPYGAPPLEMFRRGLERPNPAQAMAWRAMADFSVKDRVATMKIPALVVHGSFDNWIPYSNGKWIGEHLPGARWLSVEGAGHFPHLKQPDWFAKLLVDFIRAAGTS